MMEEQTLSRMLGEPLLGIFCVFGCIGLLALPLWEAILFGLACDALFVLGLAIILPLFWLTDWLESRHW